MTIMTYDRDLSFDGGLIISNAYTDWDTLPTNDNLKNLPIRVRNTPPSYNAESGILLTDISECAELGGGSEGSPVFSENFPAAVRGELKDFPLVGVCFNSCMIIMKFGNRKNPISYEILYVIPTQELHTVFEVECGNGRIDKYLLHTTYDQGKYSIFVTETTPLGIRKFTFGQYNPRTELTQFQNLKAMKNPYYVRITEFR